MRAANTPRRHPARGFAGDSPESPMRWVNQFTHTRRLRGSEDKEVVTPNNDTPYSWATLDLRAEGRQRRVVRHGGEVARLAVRPVAAVVGQGEFQAG